MPDEASGNNDQESRLNKVIAEFLQAVDAGEQPMPEDVIANNPQLAEDLKAFFNDYEQMGGITALMPKTKDLQEIVRAEGSNQADVPTLPATGISEEVEGRKAGDRIRYFGDYEIIKEMARGGMGVVYKARQVSLDRLVALKMILAGELAGPGDVRRFHIEAEAAANLDHPNIVPIYEVGEHEGQHYFSMKLISGESLSRHARKLARQPRRIAEFMCKVSKAIHYAHTKGVLHRDLKPGNILVDPDGTPYVTDFGLAKRIADKGTTRTGDIVGTPAYMPPEQAEGEAKRLTRAADVYSLGAILYELITGRPPFVAKSSIGVLLKVRLEEPTPPSAINPLVDRDLETICLKCLEKNAKQRYRSAYALANELDRYIKHEPILARPATNLERIKKWSRRHPALAALVAVILLSASALASGGAWYSVQLREQRDLAVANELVANTERYEANKARSRAELSEKQALQQSERANMEAHAAKLEVARGLVQRGDALMEAERIEEAKAHYKEAKKRLALLKEPTFDADYGLFNLYWKFSHPSVVLRGHQNLVLAVSFSPSGRKGISGGHDNKVIIWDLMKSRALHQLNGHTDLVSCVAFSPDEKLVASGSQDKTVRIWNAISGEEVHCFKKHTKIVRAIEFTHDGRGIISCGEDGIILFGNLASEKLTQIGSSKFENGDASEIRCMALSPDGKNILTVGEQVQLWGIKNRTLERNYFGDFTEQHYTCVDFSPDGKQFILGTGSGYIELYDKMLGVKSKSLKIHKKEVLQACFLPDGNHIVTLGADQSMKLWDLPNSRKLRSYHTPSGFVMDCASDGTKIIVGDHDKNTVRVWGTKACREVYSFESIEKIDPCRTISVSNDGRLAVSDGYYSQISGDRPVLWDLETGKAIRVLGTLVQALDRTNGIKDVCFSPDITKVYSGCGDGTIREWDVETGRQIRKFSVKGGGFGHIAVSTDGQHLAGTSQKGVATYWDLETGQVLHRLDVSAGHNVPLDFSQVENLLLMGNHRTGEFWSLKTKKLVHKLEGHTDVITSLSFLANGKKCLTGSHDGSVRKWDVLSGKEETVCWGHREWVTAVLPLSDQLVASASYDRTIRIWDITAERRARPVRTLGIQNWDTVIHIFGMSAGQRSILSFDTPWLEPLNCIEDLAYSPNKTRLLSISDEDRGGIKVWELGISDRYFSAVPGIIDAVKTMNGDPEDPEALRVLGEWYALRGIWDWATEMLEEARKGGVTVSRQMLAKCYWLQGGKHNLRKAKIEFENELKHLSAQVAPADEVARRDLSGEMRRLRLCIAALGD